MGLGLALALHRDKVDTPLDDIRGGKDLEMGMGEEGRMISI